VFRVHHGPTSIVYDTFPLMLGRSRRHLCRPIIESGQSLRSWPCKGVHAEGAVHWIARRDWRGGGAPFWNAASVLSAWTTSVEFILASLGFIFALACRSR
jgi:hypothetical protein